MYHCGSHLGWSAIFQFKTPPPEDQWQPQIAIYGDMGNENAQSLVRLQEEAQRDLYDAVFHVGDFAYDMNTVTHQSYQSVCINMSKDIIKIASNRTMRESETPS